MLDLTAVVRHQPSHRAQGVTPLPGFGLAGIFDQSWRPHRLAARGTRYAPEERCCSIAGAALNREEPGTDRRSPSLTDPEATARHAGSGHGAPLSLRAPS